jgi:hypothetical protein
MKFLAPNGVIYGDKEGRSLQVSGPRVLGNRFSHGFSPKLEDTRFLNSDAEVGIGCEDSF